MYYASKLHIQEYLPLHKPEHPMGDSVLQNAVYFKMQ